MVSLINNIDILRMPITPGNNIIYFPQNTKFKNRKISRIFTVLALDKIEPKTDATDDNIRNFIDPFNHNYIISKFEAVDILITIYSKDGKIIFNNLPLNRLSSYYVDNKLYINDYIDWELSYINIQNITLPDVQCEILFYMLSDEIIYPKTLVYKKIISIEVENNFFSGYKLSEFFNSYDLGKLVKIENCNPGYMFSDYFGEYRIWLDIVDKSNKILYNINCGLFSSYFNLLRIHTGNYNESYTDRRKCNSLYFNFIDLDFNQTIIYNLTPNSFSSGSEPQRFKQILTFYFA